MINKKTTENMKKNQARDTDICCGRERSLMRLLIFVILLIINLNLVYAQEISGSTFGGGLSQSFVGSYAVYGNSVNPQFNNPNFFSVSGFTSPEVYWPKYNQGDCLERQDFIMQIAPGGCSPAVVRSDLLEEQNVPVFCKVMSIQVNPLIDVSRIRSLRFTGDYPEGVSGLSYYPAKAALRSSRELISSPVNDNLGYLVIVLSRQEIEGNIPDYVEGKVTAIVDYDAEGAFGIGNTNFYVSEMSDDEWSRDYKEYGFWNGKGYIRADSVNSDEAVISVYRDANSKISTVRLEKWETSRDIYLSGFYCAAGLNMRLDSIGAPVESALLKIDNEEVWVAKGDRILDSNCRVLDLQTYGGGGKISISCPVENGRFELSLNPGKAKIIIDGKEEEYTVGDSLGNSFYLGYVGQNSFGDRFAVLIKDEISETEYEFADKEVYPVIEEIISESSKGFDELESEIESAVEKQYKNKVSSNLRKNIDELVSVDVVKVGGIGDFGDLEDVSVAKNKEWSSGAEEEKLAKQYYDKAIKSYEDLFDFYPNEKRIADEDAYAAIGLYEAAQLSKKFEMNEKAQEFYNRLIREYPNSNIALKAIREKELLTKYNTKDAKALVNLDNEQYFIDLLDFKKPKRSDASVVLLIDGKEETLGLNEIKEISNNLSIQVEEIDNDFVIVRYFRLGVDSKVEKIGLNDQTSFENIRIKIVKINLKKQVKLSITPKSFGPRTESNFSFKIGIEKRAIELSPEKTSKMIDNLEKTIKEWNKVNENLGKVIKGLKATCFATAAVMTVKNLVDGFSGKSMARKSLMTNSGGWNEFCENEFNEGRAISVEKCLLEHSSNINNDINIYSEEIEKTNEILKRVQEGVGIEQSDFLDFQGQVDVKKMEESFKTEFDKFCKSASGEVAVPDRDSNVVNFNDICKWDTLTHEQRREIMTLYNVGKSAETSGSSVLKNMVDRELGKVVLNGKNYWEYHGAELQAEEEAKDWGFAATRLDGEKIAPSKIYNVKKGDKIDSIGDIKPGDKVIRIFIPGLVPDNENYNPSSSVKNSNAIVKLKREKDTGIYVVDKVYGPNGEISDEITKDVSDYLGLRGVSRFRDSTEAYENPMVRDQPELKVKYFERAPYKGMPSLIPFDIDNGWYVKMTYVLSGFGKPYDESGRATNYWICNVGQNGLIEFKQSADDMCRYYNGVSSELGFYGLSESESRRIINMAQQAIAEAGKQYGNKNVVINGKTFQSGVSFEGEEGRCSDFMSPEDCNIMFNVCDPVICPASRCDLGGDFRVDNVIQTGIIGSLMLCLPNAKEGILVPICLSGVHAGIEGYLSILNSTQACLKESLETGRNIGICDEIKSIYLCEFFWKQATPLLNVIVPRLFESILSQGVRGGGEYLTVQNAWENTQSAIDYFKNDYAVNSMQAFTSRSTEEIGSAVCKSYMSATYPTGDMFDTLIEPDSPVQYYAWFSENVLTTATVPSTSHYKVYYHVYAGKDIGAYYAVYLKDLPESNYVYLSGTYIVDRGYIARGGQVDEAVDFSAVSGYKQLCISINGQEECGFGQVSTSYFLDSLTDAYAEEQIKTGIKSSRECVAGTPSLLSLAQPNLQAGVEDVINPELYNQGIIRVCSTGNPGKQVTDSGESEKGSVYDRWKEVGYCDDPTIKCWLDTSSVKDIIQNKQIEEDVLDKVDLNILDEVDYWTQNESWSVAQWADNSINTISIDTGDTESSIEIKIFDIVNKLTKLTNLGTTNVDKARGFYLLGKLYKKVAEGVKPELVREGVSEVEDVEEGGKEILDEEKEESKKGSEETKEKNKESKWTDDMLREGVLIKYSDFMYTTSKIVAYKYEFSRGWISEDDEIKEKGYVEGINYLVSKISSFGDKIIIEDKTIDKGFTDSQEEVAKKIFELLKK